jgi:hypothetical protein
MLTVIKGAGDLLPARAPLMEMRNKDCYDRAYSATAIRRASAFQRRSVGEDSGRRDRRGPGIQRSRSPGDPEKRTHSRIGRSAADCIREMRPDVVVDAILAKRNRERESETRRA